MENSSAPEREGRFANVIRARMSQHFFPMRLETYDESLSPSGQLPGTPLQAEFMDFNPDLVSCVAQHTSFG